MPTFNFKVQGLTLFLVFCEKASGFATGRVMRSCAGGSWFSFVPNAFPAEAAFPLWGVPGGFSQYQLTALPLEQPVALARRVRRRENKNLGFVHDGTPSKSALLCLPFFQKLHVTRGVGGNNASDGARATIFLPVIFWTLITILSECCNVGDAEEVGPFLFMAIA